MKGVVLAAGYGTRLLPLTREVPKPLVPVMNMPLLEVILRGLGARGIRELGVNIHHLPELLHAFLDREELRGFTFHRAEEPVILDTGGGMAHFAALMEGEERFLLHNCDVVCRFSLEELARAHRENGGIATLLLVDNAATNSVFTDGEGRITGLRGARYGEQCEGPLTYSGIALFSPRIFRYLPKGELSSIITVLMDLLQQGAERVYGRRLADVYWKDLGSVRSYLELHGDLFAGDGLELPGLPRGQGGRILGEGSAIDGGAHIEGFLAVGSGCFVGPDAHLRDCVLWDGAKVHGPARIEGAVITRSLVVSR